MEFGILPAKEGIDEGKKLSIRPNEAEQPYISVEYVRVESRIIGPFDNASENYDAVSRSDLDKWDDSFLVLVERIATDGMQRMPARECSQTRNSAKYVAQQ